MFESIHQVEHYSKNYVIWFIRALLKTPEIFSLFTEFKRFCCVVKLKYLTNNFLIWNYTDLSNFFENKKNECCICTPKFKSLFMRAKLHTTVEVLLFSIKNTYTHIPHIFTMFNYSSTLNVFHINQTHVCISVCVCVVYSWT